MTASTPGISTSYGGLRQFLGRLVPILDVGWVLVVIAAVTVGYFVAVSRGFGDLSHVTVGIAFLLGTDGLLLVFITGRRPPAVQPGEPILRPDVSVIIACYNGGDVIGDTLDHLFPHVRPENIIVVSDRSTDDTAEVARAHGVRVVENRFNRNKALSISRAAPMVTTPYTLLVDDDTLLGPEPLPVELLEQGASAVAFDVMPIETGTLVNRVQTFEYRKSMVLGKALVSDLGAVANVSGAVGLFRTADLRRQTSRHSGHFPGEDLQRTLLAHLEGEGHGVAYSPNRVVTLAPSTWRELFGQRSTKWGSAEHELLFLNVKMMLDPTIHASLRFERGYAVMVLLTDPIRMLLFTSMLFSPQYFAFLYLLYLPLELMAWVRVGRRDPIGVVLLAPIYNLFKMVARFRAHFQWFRMKWDYLVRHRYHRLVGGRNLRAEYAGIVAVLATVWVLSILGALGVFG